MEAHRSLGWRDATGSRSLPPVDGRNRRPTARRPSSVAIAVNRTVTVLAVTALLSGCTTSLNPPDGDPSGRSSLPTCGRIAASTGPLRDVLEVRLSGPHTLPVGTDFAATVTVSLRSGSRRDTAHLVTGVPVNPVIARAGNIVGAYRGAVGGVGLSATITRTRPYRFPEPATVSLRGCPRRGVDPDASNSTRQLLPPGKYTVYASVEDSTGNLRSEPFDLTVTAPTTERPRAGAATPTSR